MKRFWGFIIIGLLSSLRFAIAAEPRGVLVGKEQNTHQTILDRWDSKRFQTPKFESFTLSSVQDALSEPAETAALLSELAPAQAVLFLWRLEELARGADREKEKALSALKGLAAPEPLPVFEFRPAPLNPLIGIKAIGSQNSQVATAELYKMAADKNLDRKLRISVILGIVQREGRGSIPFLAELLKDEAEDKQIRAQILGTRALLGKGSFKKEAETILEGKPKSDSLYRAAVWGMGIDPDTGDLAFLKNRVQHSLLAPEHRISALAGLAQNERSLKFYLVDFPSLNPHERGTEEVADYFGLLYKTGKAHKLLDETLTEHFGELFAGDSFEPSGTGFGRNSRSTFESIRKKANPLEREWLDAGMRKAHNERIARTPVVSPMESVLKLIKAMPIWADDQFAESADYFFGKPFIGAWDSAMKHVGFLFLIKARDVSPEAKEISDKLVRYWLESLEGGNPGEAKKKERIAKELEGKEFLRAQLSKLGSADALKKMDESAKNPANRHRHGILDTSPIIFIHQYRNLILKEILRSYKDQMTPNQLSLVHKRLEENETELTGMLSEFKKGETTTDEITGFNTYALVTTVLVARDPSKALDLMRAKSHIEYARYFVDSEYGASPRAGAGRTVPYRLAEMVHARNDQERAVSKGKLISVANNYMKYLPDLMFHSRGRYMHSGEDQIAPYYFHPSVPFEAATLRLLAQDPKISEADRADFNQKRKELASAIIASQKSDGTFALPDTQGDLQGGGAYPSSAAWVNPLTGLALLSLIDDSTHPSTQFGILDPDWCLSTSRPEK